MTNETSFQMAHLPREQLMKGVETMALCTAKSERTDHREVEFHVLDELTGNDTMGTFVQHEEPFVSQHEKYMTQIEVEKLMDDKIKTAVEVSTRCVTTDIVEEMIKVAFAA